MQLVVVRITLQVVDGLLPVGRQDVLVLAVQALMNVGPCSGVELGGRESGGRELDRRVSRGVGFFSRQPLQLSCGVLKNTHRKAGAW